MPRALVAASLWLSCSAATFAQEPFNLAVQVEDLPDHATLVVGADFGSARVTFSLDFLGQLIIDAPRLRSREFLSLNGVSTFPDITFEENSFSELSDAVGLKLNLF